MKKVSIEPGPYVLPMPVTLVGSVVEGRPNFMPAAFIGIMNYDPPIVAAGLSPTHHTCDGITANGTFSINLPGPELVEATDWCGLHSGKQTDKSGVFDTFTEKLDTAPMIRQCRITVECRVLQTLEFAVDTVYFGEVIGVYADEDALKDGTPDWKKVAPLIFTFPDKGYWELGEYVAEAWSIGTEFEGPEKG
jgi:flavin reductase (DIM6/NTAB) family NADH-FMN oxidoreductase RutF